MKTLSINLALISLLASSQTSFAEVKRAPVNSKSAMEKVVVVATPEVANFEIFSEKLGAIAIKKAMNFVESNISNNTGDSKNNTES